MPKSNTIDRVEPGNKHDIITLHCSGMSMFGPNSSAGVEKTAAMALKIWPTSVGGITAPARAAKINTGER